MESSSRNPAAGEPSAAAGWKISTGSPSVAAVRLQRDAPGAGRLALRHPGLRQSDHGDQSRHRREEDHQPQGRSNRQSRRPRLRLQGRDVRHRVSQLARVSRGCRTARCGSYRTRFRAPTVSRFTRTACSSTNAAPAAACWNCSPTAGRRALMADGLAMPNACAVGSRRPSLLSGSAQRRHLADAAGWRRARALHQRHGDSAGGQIRPSGRADRVRIAHRRRHPDRPAKPRQEPGRDYRNRPRQPGDRARRPHLRFQLRARQRVGDCARTASRRCSNPPD